MFPPQAPWTGLGQLESKISRIESQLNGKAEQYEISSINSRLDSLEHTLSNVSSEITEIRYGLSEIQSEMPEK